MKATTAFALLGALSATTHAVPVVDDRYPYTGPAVPVGDWVNPTANGNGGGFPRLVEPPAVTPGTATPSNNVNVISLAYIPGGLNIHYQTPFGLGVAPSVKWGTSPTNLQYTATGYSHTYDRTPPCSLIAAVTQCSQFFHEVQVGGLKPDTTYYYQIPAANGTTASDVLSFVTARAAGDPRGFTMAVLNDMGYTNAGGTYKYLLQAVEEGAAFAWHGGDISYADDWYSGILPCADDWPVCYNGTSTELPGGLPIPAEYEVPLPAGEVANQGGPQGGDMSVIYESNWDLWQQWMVSITTKVPYMVLPGNHEATCSEFDGPGNVLTAYLNDDISNATVAESDLTYYSCPPSQRNFTAYQHRFRMPGDETGGVGNMWYSFDYGLAHFVSIDGETDFAYSPEWPFARDVSGNETLPTEAETYVTDSGPFGAVGNYKDTKTYAQYQWLVKDLANVDRTKTPWVIAMTHRPMYSSQVSGYQANIRAAFEAVLLQYGVDAYLSGHIHWYERLWPLTGNGSIDTPSIVNNNTYYTNPGVSMTHIINGMAGNIESHSTLSTGSNVLPITAVLDFQHYGFNKLNVINSTAITFSFVQGADGSVRDELTLLKRKPTTSSSGSSTATSVSSTATSVSSTSSTGSSTSSGSSTTSTGSFTSSSGPSTSSGVSVTSTSGSSTSTSGPATSSSVTDYPTVTYTTEVVTAYTTYCPNPTVITQGSSTYTVTEATTLTITNCPCTLTHSVTSISITLSTASPTIAAVSSAAATSAVVSSAAATPAVVSSAAATSTVVSSAAASTAITSSVAAPTAPVAGGSSYNPASTAPGTISASSAIETTSPTGESSIIASATSTLPTFSNSASRADDPLLAIFAAFVSLLIYTL